MKKENLNKETKLQKIEVRVTADEKSEVKKLADLNGKKNMSEYLLSKAFEERDMRELLKCLKERNELLLELKQLDEKIMNLTNDVLKYQNIDLGVDR